jgi:glycosyltransferase involved in cell wall biosynthesis
MTAAGGAETPGQRPELSLVIPAFNEAARLPGTIGALREFFSARDLVAEVVCVDDGSRDATPRIIAEAVGTFPRRVAVRQERHAVQSGKGAAVRTGCLAARGRYVVYTDADLAVPLAEVDRILDALRGGCDVAIGSRIQADGRDMRASQPPLRRAAGRAFTSVRQRLAVADIVDTQCPLKGFRAEVAPRLFAQQKLGGWAFDAELLFLARRARLRICEMPVVWRHVAGSKLRPGPSLAFRSLWDLLRMRWVHLRD